MRKRKQRHRQPHHPTKLLQYNGFGILKANRLLSYHNEITAICFCAIFDEFFLCTLNLAWMTPTTRSLERAYRWYWSVMEDHGHYACSDIDETGEIAITVIHSCACFIVSLVKCRLLLSSVYSNVKFLQPPTTWEQIHVHA
jgi:hypothetical protein